MSKWLGKISTKTLLLGGGDNIGVSKEKMLWNKAQESRRPW